MVTGRRQVLSMLSGAIGAAAGLAARPTLAQGSDSALKIIVGFPPGGATDTVARRLSDKIAAQLGRVVIVENKPGAGGMIATQQLKAAPPDGSTVMLTIDHTQVIVPLTFKAPGYEALADFTPLAGVAEYALSMAVSSKIGVKTLGEYKAWLKAHPEQSNFGVPAIGSVPQFAGLLVGKSMGVEMVPVPYRGGAPLVSDLIGGQIPMGIQSIAEHIEHHRRGTMHVLAVSGTRRSAVAPEIATFHDQGVEGIERNSWIAFFGPRGLQRDFVSRFSTAVETALQDRDIVEQLAKLGNEAKYAPPEELREWVSSATKHWSGVIRESGFQLQ